MHIINPLIALGKTGSYSISILFPAPSAGHAGQVKAYLKQYPGFTNIAGVIYRGETPNPTGVREHIPDGAAYLLGSSGYREALKQMLGENDFDIVVVETSFMLWTLALIRDMQPNAKVVLDLQNAEHLLLRRMAEQGGLSAENRVKYLQEYKKTLDWEKKHWPLVDACMAVSPLEAEIYKKYAPGVPVEVVVAGGGVEAKRASGNNNQLVTPFDIAFVGTMWYPNVHGLTWFLREVFPGVRNHFPQSRLHIVGSGKPPQSLVGAVRNNQSVVFWGQLEDERSVIGGAGVFVVPLFIGAGSRIKIMTAWSLGLPVVSTAIGAEGLSFKKGLDILIADTPSDFSGCVMGLLADSSLRRMLSLNGKRQFEALYSREVASQKVIRFFNSMVSNY
ncbi:MAG: glycosyltransferase [Bacillota bacterium]